MDINVNIFRININNPLSLFEDDRRKYPSLKGLREQFSCSFYADEDKLYAYGKESSKLVKIGFRAISKSPAEIPRTTCRVILEGFCNRFHSIGYSVEPRRFVMQAFDIKNPIPLTVRELQLLNGCEFRTVYIKDALTNNLVFGLILDLRYKLEYEGKSRSYADIRNLISLKYGSLRAKEAIMEIKVKTGDLTPSGKMNAQASKFRYENILRIMEQVGNKIKLPDGSEATVSLQPTPIIIEV